VLILQPSRKRTDSEGGEQTGLTRAPGWWIARVGSRQGSPGPLVGGKGGWGADRAHPGPWLVERGLRLAVFPKNSTPY